MATDFVKPDFMSGTSAAEIQRRMMNNLPDDIDGMAGGFAYDFTMPTAIEKSEVINFHIVRALMLAFPEWAWEGWLDLHGKQCGVERKAAGYASGYITVTGEAGVRMPAGFVVCTPATDSAPSVLFRLDEEIIIPESGSIDVSVTAIEAGTGSNVAAGAITIMSIPVEGIEQIVNTDDITGGTARETDAAFRERIDEAYAARNTSFIGNDADYIRWAKEVTGIGACIVTPAADGPGTVKLSLVDSNGVPANERLCAEVYEHIVSTEDRQSRLMPTGSAVLTVEPAETVEISYSCEGLETDGLSDAETIMENFKEAIAEYYQEAKEDGEVRYNRAHAILTGIAGVEDFTDFRLNENVSNIPLASTEYPATGTVYFSE